MQILLATAATPKVADTVLGNVITVSLAFIILIVLIRVFAWKAITSTFTARAKKINDDIDAAEDAHKTANALVKQRQTELAGSKTEAAGIIESANDTARQNRAKILDQANAEAATLKSHAQADIEQQRKEALNGVKSEVAGLSVQIAEKLIGKSLDANAQSELIDSYLAKLGND